MAGWLTAFKVIPWAQVLATAPAVVAGARALWDAVKKQDAPKTTGQGAVADQHALEAQVAELRRELAAASGLVADLAEQNKRLVEAVEVLRMRTRVLFAILAVVCVALVFLAVR